MILVYIDFMNSDEEIPKYKEYLDRAGVKAKVTDDPLDRHNISAFTHVFMDYGGLNLPGNSLFAMTNQVVDEFIEEYPSVEFIIISVMGKFWFEADLGNIDKPNLRFMPDFLNKNDLMQILNNE